MKVFVPVAAVAVVLSSCVPVTTAKCSSDADCKNGAACADGVCTGGDVPIASVSAPAEVSLGALVTLDGSGSHSASGIADGLQFTWTVLDPPGVQLDAASSQTATLRATKPHARYKIQLVVTDKGTASAAVIHEVQVLNSRPTARLTSTPDIWGRQSTVNFSSGTSTDGDSDSLTFQWSLNAEALLAGGTIVGVGSEAAMHTGSPLVRYTVTVVVSDGFDSATEVLSQLLGNAPPVVNAGIDLDVSHGCSGNPKRCTAQGQLTATAQDNDGTISASSYLWRLKVSPIGSGATVTFGTANQLSTSFTLTSAANAAIAGIYEFQFSATDNDADTGVDNVQVAVGNRAPTITVNTPASINHGYDVANSQFTAAVSASVATGDPDGDDLTVSWLGIETATTDSVFVPGASGPSSANYTIRVPRSSPQNLVNGTDVLYRVAARVTDPNGDAASSSAAILITNRAPSLSFTGQTSTGHSYSNVLLFGRKFEHTFTTFGFSATDLDQDPLAANWGIAETSTDGALLGVTGDLMTAPQLQLYAYNSTRFILKSIPVRARYSDPWTMAELTRNFTVGNNRPVMVSVSLGTGVRLGSPCMPSSCYECRCTIGGSCSCYGTAQATTFTGGILMSTLAAKGTDADGDPLTYRWTIFSARNELTQTTNPSCSQNSDCGATLAIGSTNANCAANTSVPVTYTGAEQLTPFPSDGIEEGLGSISGTLTINCN